MAATLIRRRGLSSEERVAQDATFEATVRRLSRQSVERHFNAYEDIDWDAPEHRIDHHDPRHVFTVDPLSKHPWFLEQTPERQAEISLFRIATCLRVGWNFENLLQQGLLVFAYRLPNGSPEFRYVHHEIVEESQHSMMFQELINRTEMPVRGMPFFIRRLAQAVAPRLAGMAPETFFFMVLGGEDPIDHLQRQILKKDGHPLVQRVMRIHVTEEARHIGFARQYLRREVPRVNRVRRALVSVSVPVIVGIMTPIMLDPPSSMARVGVPKKIIKQTRRSAESKQLRKDSVAKLRKLYVELGLANPVGKALWKLVGLWDAKAPVDTDDVPAHAAA